MIAVVQCYIHLRKGVEVNIIVRHPFEIMQLTKAYNYAIDWMKENNVKIKSI